MTLIEDPALLAEPLHLITGRTLVVTVLASRETAFNYLANIENLPRWAGGFCEKIFLDGEGRWMALSSCGELFVSLETDEIAGRIELSAGWEPDRLHPLPLAIQRDADGFVRIRFALSSGAAADQAQLFQALEPEVRGLVTRLDEGVLGRSG